MRRHCTLLIFALVLGVLFLYGMSSATVTQVKVADSKSLTNVPVNSVYETETVTVTIDPAVTNWIALSNSDNLVQLPTGDNNNIPFSGTPQINQPSVDDYVVVTVSKGSSVSSPITLDDNDAYNCRIGNQAVISGSYPSVRAVNCVDWSKSPPVTHVANFAESGQLTAFFTANGKGDYTFKIDFMNKYETEAAHGAVWLLMDVAEQVTTPIPIPDGQRRFSYQVLGKAVTAVDPFDMAPIGADCCESGGNTLGVQIRLGQFAGPTDMYLAIYAPNLLPGVHIIDKGGNLAPLSLATLPKGLVPWKESVSGPISEKLFADFPVSQLPSGTYYLFLMVTPTNTFQSYHLWITSLVVPGACVPGTVPDGSAGYVNGKVIAPNATVVYEGQQYDGQLSVSGNALVAIIRNGQAYLYHPALGNAVLSDDTSNQAVGYFLAGVSVGVQETVGSARVVNPLNAGQTVSLQTGVDITRLEDGSIQLTNKTKRFVAVETDAGFTTLVKPRDDYLETNLIKAFLRGSNRDLYGYQDVPIKANSKIQTYGAIARAPTARWQDPDVLQAFDQNKWLYIDTNAADTVFFVLEGIKRIIGITIPEACLESIAIQVPFGIAENYVLTTIADRTYSWKTYQGSTTQKLFKEYLYEVGDAVMKCATVAVALPVAEGVFKFLDVVSFIDWGVVDTLGVALANTYLYKAYDELILSSNILQLLCTASGDLTVNEQGDVLMVCTTTANPVSTTLVSGFADLSGLGGPANFQLVPWQGGTLRNTAIVTPPKSGDIVVYFKATDNQGREGTATASINVKSQKLAITNCSATGTLYAGKTGSVIVSCTMTGDVASVSADLSKLGTAQPLAMNDMGSGTWQGTGTVTPATAGDTSIVVTAVGKTGGQDSWNTSIMVYTPATIIMPSFPATYTGTATMDATIFNTKGNASCTGTFDLEITLTTQGDVTWRTNWEYDPKVTYPASCTITRGAWYDSIFSEWGTHDFKGNFTMNLFCQGLKGTYDNIQLQGGCSWSDSGSSGDVSFVLPRKQ